MQAENNSQSPDTTGPTIRLRTERFDLYTRVLGCESELDRARLLRVATKTISRARDGMIGEKFIAHTLSVLLKRAAELRQLNLDVSFEEIFDVVHCEESAN